jgi:hypothetical protein
MKSQFQHVYYCSSRKSHKPYIPVLSNLVHLELSTVKTQFNINIRTVKHKIIKVGCIAFLFRTDVFLFSQCENTDFHFCQISRVHRIQVNDTFQHTTFSSLQCEKYLCNRMKSLRHAQTFRHCNNADNATAR